MNAWRDVIVYGVAIAALVAFFFFVRYLLGRVATAEELEWTRAVYLFSGVEAIVFAATGFLFGKEVHRKQAEKAEKAEARANNAETESVENKTKLKVLSDSINVKVAQRVGSTDPEAAKAEDLLKDLQELGNTAQAMLSQ